MLPRSKLYAKTTRVTLIVLLLCECFVSGGVTEKRNTFTSFAQTGIVGFRCKYVREAHQNPFSPPWPLKFLTHARDAWYGD